MSVIFGRWNYDGRASTLDYLHQVRKALAHYGPDGCNSYCKEGVSLLYQAFHTTGEACRAVQPLITRAGAIICWDGRLDNRDELIRQLKDELPQRSADVLIVAAAFEQWGTRCFGQLIGDWALSIVNPIARTLILAIDPIGVRHLYYSFDREQVTWSTILDPLILFSEKRIALDEKFIASWFGTFPAVQLTPYVGTHSLPPSTFLTVQAGKCNLTQYWNFDPHREIRYRKDVEYEEHFRTVFSESVRRRLRSNAPVLAELSGGMDSSSIVCMADKLISSSATDTKQLDTLSYYDNSEPNWDEQPYFSKVEEKRGRIGHHIDIQGQELLQLRPETDGFSSLPKLGCPAGEASRQFASYISLNGNRVVLSGFGGDEVTGGVPSPIPELSDLLATGRFGVLAQQLTAWALEKRKPWTHLLYETCQSFLPRLLPGIGKNRPAVSWLQARFVERNLRELSIHDCRLKLFGPLPSFQENLSTLELLQKQMACEVLSPDLACEIRYPFLDRDLLEFIYAIPRDQLVRPGQRRSLLRRALVGIVPDEILNRRRKAYPSRAPATAISQHCQTLVSMAPDMVCTHVGIINQEAFCKVVKMAASGQELPIVFLARTLAVESWLKNLRHVSPSIPGGIEFRGQRLDREISGTETLVAGLTSSRPKILNSTGLLRLTDRGKVFLS